MGSAGEREALSPWVGRSEVRPRRLRKRRLRPTSPPVHKLGGMGNGVSVDLRSNRVASWDQLPRNVRARNVFGFRVFGHRADRATAAHQRFSGNI
jgi:hypothetical protein